MTDDDRSPVPQRLGVAPARHSLVIPPPEILNGVQFAVRTGMGGSEGGGASFDTSTKRFLDVGRDKGYVVGGEPDVHNDRIPTVHVPGDHLSVRAAMDHIARVGDQTGHRPNAIAGSWRVPGDRIDLDASSAMTNKRSALKVATSRNEEAIWDNHKGEEVLTSIGRRKRRQEFSAGQANA